MKWKRTVSNLNADDDDMLLENNVSFFTGDAIHIIPKLVHIFDAQVVSILGVEAATTT